MPSQKSSNYSISDPRILTGHDRTKFVTTTMASTFRPEATDAEAMNISRKVMTKVNHLVSLQSDKSHLERECLPSMPKEYKAPVIQNRVENKRNNCFVVTNDSHSRQTNNGYSRRDKDGGFYCH